MKRSKAARPTNPKARRPRTVFSTAKQRSRHANPIDLTLQGVAVYDGARHLGFLTSRGKAGIEAYDASEHSLGCYPDQAAADAVARAAAGAP